MPLFSSKRIFILLLICSALFLLGNNLFSLSDPDEVFYSLTAKEMAAHNEWLVPLIFGQPQFEKPPLTYWLLDTAFKMGGESPFTARLFPALFATLGVMAVYFLGLMGFQDERKAFFSALLLSTSAFFAGMGKTVFTDMIFTVFILLALTMFVFGFTQPKRQAMGWVGFFIFCALATLTKGPLGLAIPLMTVVLFLMYGRQMNYLKNEWIIVGLLLYVIIALPWYEYIYTLYGKTFIHEFFYNDHWRRLFEAEHRGNDHWFFYPLTMVLGLFPWSLFLVAAFIDLFKRLKNWVALIDYFLLSWIVVVFVVFQIAHSKLASYILPVFPALALLAGQFIVNRLSDVQHEKSVRKLLSASFIILALLGIVVIAGYHFYQHYISSMAPVYFLSGSLIALYGVGFSLLLQGRLKVAFYVLALTLCPVFLTACLMQGDVDKLVSSYQASQYIPQHTQKPMTVLTSKANVRGIRYYTGQDVAVVDANNQPFFSPHPVRVLDTTDKLMKVLRNQPVTYGVVRRSGYKNILKNCTGHYQVNLLANTGFDYIIKIEAIKGRP
ncbi:MAG: glycosyltransferase family 39 protein [Candidatus Omnitrophica bacterium]|nr:glycosyltransferase family 39 protein [Candidatus Omnitrophota bacterium]